MIMINVQRMIAPHMEDALTHALNVMIRTCVLKIHVTHHLDVKTHQFLTMIITNVLKIFAALIKDPNM
jgi:hypothetical protein